MHEARRLLNSKELEELKWDVARIDERKLNTLINKPWAADGKNFSQRIWQQKSQLINELHNQLTRACILGKAPDEAINEIARKFKTTKHQASRLVMTEQAYFHSVAQKEAFNELDVEEYEIVATLDSHTSDICREMDGKHFPMSDYKEGVTAPPFHVFCRSVTVPWFEDNFNGQRAARGEDGKTYYVPNSMTYEEWRNSFVDGGSKDDLTPIAKTRRIVVTNTVKDYASAPFGSKDITQEWLAQTRVSKHEVEDVYEFVQDDVKYTVDGNDVQLKYKDYEKQIAEVLHNKYGQDVLMMPKVNNPSNIKTPDFLIDGKRFDLKTPEGLGEEVLYGMVNKKKGQADNFIFDISKCPLSEDALIEQAKKIFTSIHTKFVNEIIMMKDDKIILVLQRG